MNIDSNLHEEPKEFPKDGGNQKGEENQLWNKTEVQKKPDQSQKHPDYYLKEGEEFVNFNQQEGK